MVDIALESVQLAVKHHHDWGTRTGSLEIVERASGRRLFQGPAPALTQLWVSPDSRFVVGLSNIKLDNPVQLIVLTRDGKLVTQAGMHGAPGVIESVSNWIYWYKEPVPRMDLQTVSGVARLSIETPNGSMRDFYFPDRGR